MGSKVVDDDDDDILTFSDWNNNSKKNRSKNKKVFNTNTSQAASLFFFKTCKSDLSLKSANIYRGITGMTDLLQYLIVRWRWVVAESNTGCTKVHYWLRKDQLVRQSSQTHSNLLSLSLFHAHPCTFFRHSHIHSLSFPPSHSDTHSHRHTRTSWMAFERASKSFNSLFLQPPPCFFSVKNRRLPLFSAQTLLPK